MAKDDIDKKIAELIHEAEQAGAAFREVAKMLGAFRAGLVEVGFAPDEIVPLCIAQLSLWWTSMMNDQKDDD